MRRQRGALSAVFKEALGREAGNGKHGPVPEDGRRGKARGDGGDAHALVRGRHLGQVVQVGRHPPDGRPKVHVARAAQRRHHQLYSPPHPENYNEIIVLILNT